MDYETLTLEKADGIATLTLNRPDRLNALTVQMADELLSAFRKVDADDEIRVLVITGAGRAFCAGADVNRFAAAVEARRRGEHRPPYLASIVGNGPIIMQEMGKPIIAAINGPAVGFGCTLALACDIRIASQEATMGAVFARVGLTPEYGSTFNLPRLVGIAKACELVFTTKIIDAKEAKEIGLVNQVVPAAELLKVTREMALTIAEMPPVAIRLAKRGLYQGLESSLATQVHWETMAINTCFQTEDHAEGVTAFLEKRKAKFQGK
ncbi:MAG: enoyl-CoA hydratase-related protein [Chloroflexota bacterium]